MKNGLLHRRRRVDANHKQIKQAFLEVGFSVVDLATVGKGCPDLLVARCGESCLVEIKTAKGKTTPHQEVFRANWKGQIFECRTIDDVQRVLDLMWTKIKLIGNNH